LTNDQRSAALSRVWGEPGEASSQTKNLLGNGRIYRMEESIACGIKAGDVVRCWRLKNSGGPFYATVVEDYDGGWHVKIATPTGPHQWPRYDVSRPRGQPTPNPTDREE
jgi:hypothetical protein